MFGHQDNQAGQSDQVAATDSMQDSVTAALADEGHFNRPATASGTGTNAGGSASAWQHPGQALEETKSQKDDVISPAGGYPQALSSKEPILSPTPMPTMSNHPHMSLTPDDNQLVDATDEDLLEVKQKALDELFPLIDKLNQPPAEHFKVLMMIIQASDNHTLIKKAYEVAQTIDEEKARAQALLDIINEINYFTQQPEV